MSADNGIYILQTKDSFRVIHSQAIENLFHSYIIGRYETDEIIPTRAVEKFGYVPYTRDKEKAFHIAEKMDKEYQTEYGVKLFSTNKSWKKILLEAKTIAPLEIEILKSNDKFDNSYWISNLERVLNK